MLDNHPERLTEVKGIGKVRARSIIESWAKDKEIRNIMSWLKKYDIPNGLCDKIFSKYGRNSVHLLEENPYRLADDINGVGFKKADDAARRIGMPFDCEFRILSGILQVLKDAVEAGHTYLDRDELLTVASSPAYLSLPRERVEGVYEERVLSGDCRRLNDEGGCVYLPYMLKAERYVASKLLALASYVDAFSDEPDIASIERRTGVSYAGAQREAVRRALTSGVFVLTGGPGTGKTVTTKAIITAIEDSGGTVLLAAPTGRAAKRLSEVTGRPASTIHRLLGAGKEGFQHGEENPLTGSALVVDECSMVDLPLMHALMKAVPPDMKVVLVGDEDQLPSVGPGSVLRDTLSSGAVPMVRLTEIFRQSRDSDIVMNAHIINRGGMPVVRPDGRHDFYIVNVPERAAVADFVVSLVSQRIPAKGRYSPKDIQVLSPMRRDWDPIGVVQLNTRLQEVLNPSEEKVVRGATEFRPGDRVMQIRNNYDKDVYNGDMGVVTSLDVQEGVVCVDFGLEADVTYKRSELNELELSYACTIHKSQGSEYPVVIIPVHESQAIMLRRNLLYTGVTRARELCILVGTRKAIAMAVGQEDTARRLSGLADRLRGTIPGNLALGGNTAPVRAGDEAPVKTTLF